MPIEPPTRATVKPDLRRSLKDATRAVKSDTSKVERLKRDIGDLTSLIDQREKDLDGFDARAARDLAAAKQEGQERQDKIIQLRQRLAIEPSLTDADRADLTTQLNQKLDELRPAQERLSDAEKAAGHPEVGKEALAKAIAEARAKLGADQADLPGWNERCQTDWASLERIRRQLVVQELGTQKPGMVNALLWRLRFGYDPLPYQAAPRH